jgi:hypothetical protein
MALASLMVLTWCATIWASFTEEKPKDQIGGLKKADPKTDEPTPFGSDPRTYTSLCVGV